MGAYNGSGTFVRSYSWTTDAANSVNITASRMDTEDNGFAAGLSNCLTKDGQNTATAALPMGGQKITGLANGTVATDAAAYGQITGFASLSGATFTGKVITLASVTGTAGFNVPAGVAPTSPVAGDIWATSSAFFGFINSATVQFATLAGTETLTNKTLDASCAVGAGGTIVSTSPGYRGLPQNSQSGAYTLVLTDAGKHIYISTGGVVIPANGTVAFPIGTTIVIVNNSGSTQTISITTDTLTWAGTTTTGTRTLLANGIASVLKTSATTWLATGNLS